MAAGSFILPYESPVLFALSKILFRTLCSPIIMHDSPCLFQDRFILYGDGICLFRLVICDGDSINFLVVFINYLICTGTATTALYLESARERSIFRDGKRLRIIFFRRSQCPVKGFLLLYLGRNEVVDVHGRLIGQDIGVVVSFDFHTCGLSGPADKFFRIEKLTFLTVKVFIPHQLLRFPYQHLGCGRPVAKGIGRAVILVIL